MMSDASLLIRTNRLIDACERADVSRVERLLQEKAYRKLVNARSPMRENQTALGAVMRLLLQCIADIVVLEERKTKLIHHLPHLQTREQGVNAGIIGGRAPQQSSREDDDADRIIGDDDDAAGRDKEVHDDLVPDRTMLNTLHVVQQAPVVPRRTMTATDRGVLRAVGRCQELATLLVTRFGASVHLVNVRTGTPRVALPLVPKNWRKRPVFEAVVVFLAELAEQVSCEVNDECLKILSDLLQLFTTSEPALLHEPILIQHLQALPVAVRREANWFRRGPLLLLWRGPRKSSLSPQEVLPTRQNTTRTEQGERPEGRSVAEVQDIEGATAAPQEPSAAPLAVVAAASQQGDESPKTPHPRWNLRSNKQRDLVSQLSGERLLVASFRSIPEDVLRIVLNFV
ncbi:unnamed protein product [Amoebophrya sp. A120]|nr:unnamed protein product [Amoebophrya sp. A120]|eukprot:GSA120T00002016001.1